VTDQRERYLDLMIRVLTDMVYERPDVFDARENGVDWPSRAHTMVGIKRLENLRACARSVFEDGVPGDFMETGVWRGGATIFMRALLAAYDDPARAVWVADSFAGLPAPDPVAYPADAGDRLHLEAPLAVSLAEVRENFSRYGLLDERVRFVPGWFRDTLPACPVERLALLRLDGDMYESTIVALEALYPRLSVGGYVIVDDYGAIAACKQAVDDYRARNGIHDEIHSIDWTGVFWKRTTP
jgi:hypothetical protein